MEVQNQMSLRQNLEKKFGGCVQRDMNGKLLLVIEHIQKVIVQFVIELRRTQTRNLTNNENLLRSFYEEVSKSPYFLLIMI